MKIVIEGVIPSLKNSKQLYKNARTGKSFITSSDRSKRWRTDALWQLKGKDVVTKYPISCTMVFFWGDKRRRDMDNTASGVLDVLRDGGIIEDDDYTHIDTLTLQSGGYDKQNPRVEIYLDE